MWRSEPQIPLAVIATIASSAALQLRVGALLDADLAHVLECHGSHSASS